jgi:hypothetical protein
MDIVLKKKTIQLKNGKKRNYYYKIENNKYIRIQKTIYYNLKGGNMCNNTYNEKDFLNLQCSLLKTDIDRIDNLEYKLDLEHYEPSLLKKNKKKIDNVNCSKKEYNEIYKDISTIQNSSCGSFRVSNTYYEKENSEDKEKINKSLENLIENYQIFALSNPTKIPKYFQGLSYIGLMTLYLTDEKFLNNHYYIINNNTANTANTTNTTNTANTPNTTNTTNTTNTANNTRTVNEISYSLKFLLIYSSVMNDLQSIITDVKKNYILIQGELKTPIMDGFKNDKRFTSILNEFIKYRDNNQINNEIYGQLLVTSMLSFYTSSYCIPSVGGNNSNIYVEDLRFHERLFINICRLFNTSQIDYSNCTTIKRSVIPDNSDIIKDMKQKTRQFLFKTVIPFSICKLPLKGKTRQKFKLDTFEYINVWYYNILMRIMEIQNNMNTLSYEKIKEIVDFPDFTINNKENTELYATFKKIKSK